MADSFNRQAIDALVTRARVTSGKQFELIDDRVSGLRIRAGERSVTWLLISRLANGKRSRIKLGVWPSMGVSDARKAAQAMKQQVADGNDPNELKREVARQATVAATNRRTLREILDQYEAVKLVQLKRGAAVRRALDGKAGILRDFLGREPLSILRIEVAEAIRRHATKSPMAANRNLAYARAFFNWCVAEELIETNPAATIKKPSKERQRDRYHSLDELREIWTATGTLGYPFGPFYRLQIVLPMRREEIAAMPLAELDLGSDDAPDDAIWILPADRTKRANALRVPLSATARSIIIQAIANPARPANSPFVFSLTGGTPISGFTKAKRRLDAAIQNARIIESERLGCVAEVMPHWTVHDLRTTFSTQACDELGIEIAVLDRILNHVATATISKMMRVYHKSELFEPRKRALAAWAKLIEELSEVRS